MNKKYILIICLITFLIPTSRCYNKIPDKIPTGEWKYKLLVNGIEVGSAKSSNRVIDNNYVVTTELRMGMGDTVNISKQIHIETLNFIPVKIETYNKTLQGNNITEVNTFAAFNGRKVEVSDGKNKTAVTIDRDFRLEGNYILSELIRGKFKKGMKIEYYIYDPSIELESPILIKVFVHGYKNVKVGGKIMRLIHISESLENIKSIDFYVNEKCIMIKTIIQMLNIKIELIKE